MTDSMSTTREATGEPTPEQFAELDRRVAESKAETRGWNAALAAVDAAVRAEEDKASVEDYYDPDYYGALNVVRDRVAHLRQGEPT